MTVNLVQHSPLTQSDITRMPKSAMAAATTAGLAADSYTSTKKSSFGKTILKLGMLAAAVVALKRFGQNTFLKVADPANMQFLDKVKTGIVKLGGWIETPFIKGYNYLKGLIGTKGAA